MLFSCEPITDCLCCGKSEFEQILDLGQQPLANTLEENAPTYPLKVYLCKNCTHMQLSHCVDRKGIFTDYCYVSGTTDTLREHFRKLANKENFVSFGLDQVWENPRVLDLACNDGTLLKEFKNQGWDTYGVDPAKNLIQKSREYGTVDCAFWGTGTRLKMPRMDLITACNVLGHADNPHQFLQEACYALKPYGKMIVEVPDGDKLIEKREWDTVYSEHLSYFTELSFHHLARRSGFRIDRVDHVPIHGGSLRFNLIPQYYHSPYSLQGSVDRCVEDLTSMMNAVNGRKIGFGASAKGNTLLAASKIKLDYIIDENPLKQGKCNPTGIPIVGIEKLLEEKEAIIILVLAWNFLEEIVKKVKSIRYNPDDKWILYVPRVRYCDYTHFPFLE